MALNGIERKPISLDSWSAVLSWRNDPLVYVWNRVNRPISLQEHLSWFENRQSRIESEPIFSYHHNRNLIGVARLDFLSELNYEVSLIVNPLFQGNGYGKQILADVCRHFSNCYPKQSRLIAVIHLHNLRSQHLFKALGFQLLSEQASFRTYVLKSN